MKTKILITGVAGFIGFHLCKKLINLNFEVIGIDNLNSYYDKNLKTERLKLIDNLCKGKNIYWKFFEGNLENYKLLEEIFREHEPEIIINLAAQAGVRYSIENPSAYINSNLVGFSNILECCRKFPIKHFLYASSSSVYGGNKKLPFAENDPVDHPISLYAATKRSNELIAHSYSHLFNIPCTALRFFTVYGPWGRPDMAPMIFTKAILENSPINIFNNGLMTRDFTFVDDVVHVIFLLLNKIPRPNNINENIISGPSNTWAPYRILNIGNSKPIKLMDFISCLEIELNLKANKKYLEMQQGDVQNTYASTSEIEKLIEYKPQTTLKKGVKEFIIWYKKFYNY